MGDLKLQNEADQETCPVDDNKRISNWIRGIDSGGCDEGVYELENDKAVTPATPTRRLTPHLYYEENSPTNTTFSGGSIFNTPHRPRDAWNGDPFRDDLSIATSVSHEHEYIQSKSKQCNQILAPEVSTLSRPYSVVSFEPPSELDQEVEDELGDFPDIAPPSPCLVPDQPRIVRLASCLQCTLEGLPCSRSVPSCSRCKRAGKPETCLLYRQKFLEEIRRSDSETCTALVLLKLKDEGPATWQEKLATEKEVCGLLFFPSNDGPWLRIEQLHAAKLAKQDRDNWVLPPVCSPRGNFRHASVHVPKPKLGEGPSDWVHRELYVDMEL